MPNIQDFPISKFEDGILVIGMAPPFDLGGQSVEFRSSKRIGGSGGAFPLKSVASGFNGQSGITLTDSGQGVMNVLINSIDSSGLDYGNYAYSVRITSSGQNTETTLGYVLLMP